MDPAGLWLAARHPEVNRTDFEGRRHRYGRRHNFCPSSPVYAGHPTVEAAQRVAPDGTRLLFLLNHAREAARLTAHASATELLTGKRVEEGEALTLDPLGAVVLRLQ